MSKFKAGDKAIINAGYSFDGKIGIVEEVIPGGYFVKCPEHPRRKNWTCLESDLLPLKSKTKILITTDGTTTLARLYEGDKVVKRAEAKCSPKDTYDFATGANLAYQRLMDVVVAQPCDLPVEPKEDKPEPTPEPIKLYCVADYEPGVWITKGKVYDVIDGYITFDDGYRREWADMGKKSSMASPLFPLVKRPANVGETIMATSNDGASSKIEVNKTYKVTRVHDTGACVNWVSVDVGDRSTALRYEQYLVLDGYQPEPEEPKFYSGKVVCVGEDWFGAWSVGKVYDVVNGTITDNNGRKITRCATVKDIQCAICNNAKFIEFKGE